MGDVRGGARPLIARARIRAWPAQAISAQSKSVISTGQIKTMWLGKLNVEASTHSFAAQLRAMADAARNASNEDPWEPALRKLKGRVGPDGVERISTHDVFDILEVPMRHRPSRTVRLSGVMRRLGWSNIRARGLNPGSYRDRVRGYAREVQGHPATVRNPNEF